MRRRASALLLTAALAGGVAFTAPAAHAAPAASTVSASDSAEFGTASVCKDRAKTAKKIAALQAEAEKLWKLGRKAEATKKKAEAAKLAAALRKCPKPI
ncbi:hypothetical protein MTQ01_11830 [Streptomyces sp. XM4193]|uniref:hypothetical protein n=1 Tax=Streptomyces sp. XM4193 TaxID=2929782 RepID=UPI001FF90261|nr:hypothetical protein [Streptomyces sp. XM4193]MCK1796693.1 hypothetical protein [Streptomyces sp. XM4193]